MRYLIIGNSAAGVSAATEIRNYDKKGEITIVGKEDFPAYGRPMISYFLKNKVTLEKLPVFSSGFYKENAINVIIDEAIKINKEEKTVSLLSGKVLSYDKLILSTGSIPFIPPVNNLKGQSNVYTFLDVKNAIALKEAVNSRTKVVILGGGLIALKAAEGLRGITENISVIELADRILPTILNNSASEIVREHIEKQGIKFYLSNSIKEVRGEKSVESVLLNDGTELPCDVLIMAVGVRPEIKLAKDIGIEIGRAIKINNRFETSVEDIYAAGDCTEILDVLDNKVKIIALWPSAVIGGKIAGANAAGADKTLEGTFPYNAIDFFGLRMITGGIINPDDSYDVKIIEDERGYSVFVINDDKLYGYMLIGNVERAGLFTDIIRNGYKLSELKDVLNTRNFLSYDKELRALKYKGLV